MADDRRDEDRRDDVAALDDAAFEEELARQQRRRKRAVLVAVGVVAVAVAGVVVFLLTRPDPLCRADDVDAVIGLGRLEALHAACAFPPAVEDTLGSIAQAPPSFRRLVALKLVATEPGLFLASCPRALQAFAAAGEAAPDARWDAFAAECPLDGFPFADARQIRAASIDRLAIAIAVHNSLAPTDGSAAARLARFALTAR